MLLHGYPQTHLMWHGVAGPLAERFTVVAADLPGYGASFRPVPAPDHEPHAKCALARDLAKAMALLGHDRFAVAGYDRGGRVVYWTDLDHLEGVLAPPGLLATYRKLFQVASTVEAICEDYRAGANLS